MNWIKNISVVLIATIMSLLASELVLSYFKPVSMRSDPKWVPDGYTRGHYKPNQAIKGSVGHNVTNPYPRLESARYTLNKYGYRGKNWDVRHPKNIAFFGGSSTFSFHDNDKDAWPFITTNCLNAGENFVYQNLNFSHPGYSIFDAPHLMLQKAMHFNIDWIITYHLWNDIKFIRALAANPEYLFNTGVAKSETSLKSILLDLGIFPNLIGNLNLIYKRFIKDIRENTQGGINGIRISDRSIDSAIAAIRVQYLSLIKLSPVNQKFLLIKQGLLLDRNSDIYDAEIRWEYIGLSKEQFLYVQEKYYSMLDSLALDNRNVRVINSDNIIPKNLMMYDDHVHLQRAAQRILGNSVCEYLKTELQ